MSSEKKKLLPKRSVVMAAMSNLPPQTTNPPSLHIRHGRSQPPFSATTTTPLHSTPSGLQPKSHQSVKQMQAAMVTATIMLSR